MHSFGPFVSSIIEKVVERECPYSTTVVVYLCLIAIALDVMVYVLLHELCARHGRGSGKQHGTGPAPAKKKGVVCAHATFCSRA